MAKLDGVGQRFLSGMALRLAEVQNQIMDK
jgi:hypothetical protein